MLSTPKDLWAMYDVHLSLMGKHVVDRVLSNAETVKSFGPMHLCEITERLLQHCTECRCGLVMKILSVCLSNV